MPDRRWPAKRDIDGVKQYSIRPDQTAPLSAWAALIPDHDEPSVHRPRLCALLDRAQRLAVVKAPVGFGKSVLVAQWVMRRSIGPHRVVLVSGNDVGGSTSSQRFEGAAGIEFLGHSLGRLTEPLLLVVDAFERLSGTGIARELTDLVRRSDLVSVVVAGRSTGGLEKKPDVGFVPTVLTEYDMVFSPAETALIVGGIAPDLPDSDLFECHKQLRGWPLAVKELAHLLTEIGPPEDLESMCAIALTRASRVLSAEIGDEGFAKAGPLSLTKKFDLDLASNLLVTSSGSLERRMSPVPNADALIGRFEHNGLVHRSVIPAEHSLWWSPILREVVAQEFTRRHPERVCGLEEALADWYVSSGDPRNALLHAANARRWDMVVGLLDAHPMLLVNALDGDLARAVAAAPAELMLSASVAPIARALVLELPLDARTTHRTEPLTGGELYAVSSGPNVRHEIEKQLLMLSLFRRRGLFEQAAVSCTNVKALMSSAIVSRTEEVASLQSSALLQSAMLHELVGDSQVACLELKQAHSRSTVSDAPFSGADAAGRLAMSQAMLGDHRRAEAWRGRATETDGWATGLNRYLKGPVAIADALVSVRALDSERCEAALLAMDDNGDALEYDELWPFVAYCRAAHGLLWGDRLSSLDQLEASWVPIDLLTSALANGGVAGPLLAAARAELFMALGRGNDARAVLDSCSRDHPLLRVARARFALLSGANESAIALTNAVTDHVPGGDGAPVSERPGSTASSLLQRLESMVIQVVARNRIGMRDAACDLLRRAVNQAEQLGLLLPFVGVPRAELDEVAGSVPSASELLRSAPLAHFGDIYPPTVGLVTLTEREKSILVGLVAGMDLRRIASSGYVSINTIKTQLRVLYRKLNVTSREQALLAATELHLLPICIATQHEEPGVNVHADAT
jgi:LuxR family transcriptional regulator, maltose regulon positive regulatory protein